MFIIYFYDNETSKITVLDFAISLENIEKKMIYYGKEFIENENGKKHLDKCVKPYNYDLSIEPNGYYLIKNDDVINLVNKDIVIENNNGWFLTNQQIKPIIKNIGYYAFSEFSREILHPYSSTASICDILPKIDKKLYNDKINTNTGVISNMINLMKETGFKPNKNCKFTIKKIK